MDHKIEYRVRPVTRYIVTRFEQVTSDEGASSYGGNSTQLGEFDDPTSAYVTAYSCCKVEHGRLGWPAGDERIQYPGIVEGADYSRVRF
jgi:hypothetical protein